MVTWDRGLAVGSGYRVALQVSSPKAEDGKIPYSQPSHLEKNKNQSESQIAVPGIPQVMREFTCRLTAHTS